MHMIKITSTTDIFIGTSSRKAKSNLMILSVLKLLCSYQNGSTLERHSEEVYWLPVCETSPVDKYRVSVSEADRIEFK